MKDIRPRPRLDRAVASESHPFSLSSNITFQFWDSLQERPSDHPVQISDHWWFQAEEPDAPAGWKAGSAWQKGLRKGVRSRILYRDGERRRLSSEQRLVLDVGEEPLPIGYMQGRGAS